MIFSCSVPTYLYENPATDVILSHTGPNETVSDDNFRQSGEAELEQCEQFVGSGQKLSLIHI